MITTSQLNRQLTLISYDYLPGDSGGLTPVVAEQMTIWGNVIPLNGGSAVNFGQEKNFADYKITIRYHSQVTENWNIIYEGKTLSIKQMQVDDEGYKRYLTIFASTSIQQQSWS